MREAVFEIDSGTGRRLIRLADCMTAADEERAAELEYRWIKKLRLLDIGGQPMRGRFTYRGDSLWWFTELYLHKRRVILDLFRMTAGLQQLITRERPLELKLISGDPLVRGLAAQIARRHHVRYCGPANFESGRLAIVRLGLRSRALAWGVAAARFRQTARPTAPAKVAAFVHRAFWRAGKSDGSAESYIGAVLESMERRLREGDVRYVSVGPPENFSSRRWWHPLRPGPQTATLPIEALAPFAALRDSRKFWRARHRLLRALLNSAAIRQHAVVDGIDWWSPVKVELAGVVLLQWTWSTRSMDEAGAALDALRPAATVTYAEAGGWGRALMLESRRRGIPSLGLQHGFIYRHWLNYRHEPDEMAPVPGTSDSGFPHPDLTLLFDRYALEHLVAAGRFPRHALSVTGSPRLDALVSAARSLTTEEIERARREAGVAANQAIVLVVTKFKEARNLLGAFVAAAGSMPDVHVVIKAHPAETPEMYRPLVEGSGNICVLAADAPLPPLLAAARAVVTVNSTLALDAAVLDIPALVLGLPNNLSPFVESGAMAGVAQGADIEAELRRILYDEKFRQQLEAGRRAFLERFAINADGGAAKRAADAVLSRIGQRPRPVKRGERS